ncbi:MAG TPA: 1,4-alpha-glucan branching protein GlgB [Ilumatobacteraceae bacterium]|nr:1,4-alpha-glucan branching protein GlgB [Ilumatobacteraceae bacterium]
MPSVARPIGDLDLHLFGEGTHRRLWELLGPQPLTVDDTGAGRSIRFGVWAPHAVRVEVTGDWNDWTPEPLSRLAGVTGIWTTVAPAARSGDRYKFVVTGADGRAVLKADPMARQTELPPSDASVVPMADRHDWRDHEWMSSRGSTLAGTSPLRIYEVHLGSWRRGLETWDDLAGPLADHVLRLGFTHVELMPIAEHPFGGSWGYQVSAYYAPTARFGDPDGLRRFVDELHVRGLGVIVDWVPAHFPRDEWSLGRFDGTALYEHADPQRGEHPDWGTNVFDYGRNEVRNFLVANALYWLDEFHVDGLRVDAVASMLYLDYSRGPGQWSPNEFGGREHLEALAFLRETTGVIADEFPDALVIAEESTSWPGVTAPIADGGLGFTHKWNLGWMHDTLGYLGHDPIERSRHHHQLTFALLYAFDERFVLPLGHDEVVHGKGSLLGKMMGDDWQRFAALRALYAWQWALPGAPLVFMGAELAPWEEWNHEAELPWHLLDHAPHRGVHDLLGALNDAADRCPALWRRDSDPEGFQWLDADDADHSLYAFVRWDVDGRSAVVCIANFTPVARPGYRVGLPWGGPWEVEVDTDDARWWGSGHRDEDRRSVTGTDEAWQSLGSSAVLDVGPMSVIWLGASSPD